MARIEQLTDFIFENADHTKESLFNLRDIPDLLNDAVGPYAPIYSESPISQNPKLRLEWTDSEKLQIQELRETCVKDNYFSAEDLERLDVAFELLRLGHLGQLRDSGERYTHHCLRVADTLAEMNFNPNIVIAGLLHDILEDSESNEFPIAYEDIVNVLSLPMNDDQRKFERAMIALDIAKLAKGCRNAEWYVDLTRLPVYQNATADEIKREYDRQSSIIIFEQFTGDKEKDPRVVLIKLADRLDNMRTIRGKRSTYKQYLKAVETYEVSAKVAELMGEFEIRDELADLAYGVIDPRWFSYIADTILKSAGQQEVKPLEYDGYRKTREAFSALYDENSLKAELQHIIGLDNLGLSSAEIKISLPNLVALRQTWKAKELGKGRFSRSDLYAKVHLIVPDNLLLASSELKTYLQRVIGKFEEYSWHVVRDYNVKGKKPEDEEQSVFIRNIRDRRLLRVKLVKGSSELAKRAKISILYKSKLDDFEQAYIRPEAEKKKARLAGNYQILVRGLEGSDQILSSLVNEVDGIRVKGTKAGQVTVLPENATLIHYAYKIRPEHFSEVTAGRINGGELILSDRFASVFLRDGDQVELTYGARSGLSNQVTPEWLTVAYEDSNLTKAIAKLLEDNLQYFLLNNSITYNRWLEVIRAIGLSHLEQMMLYERVLGLSTVLPLIQSLNYSDESDFLKGVAYGEVKEVDLTAIAEELERESQSVMGLDLYHHDYRIQSLITVLCGNTGIEIVSKEEIKIRESDFVRFTIKVEDHEKAEALFKAIAGIPIKSERMNLIQKMALFISHLQPENAERFSELIYLFNSLQKESEYTPIVITDKGRKKRKKDSRRTRTKTKHKKWGRRGPKRR